MPAYLVFRHALPVALLAAATQTFALSLGEIHTSAALGESLRAEIDLQVAPREIVDSSCFRLRAGDDDALPWLRQATLTYRKGPPAVLEIRSPAPLRDPVLRLAVTVGCGHELKREYTLLFSPGRGDEPPGRPAVRRPEAAPLQVEPALPATRPARRPRVEPGLPPQERLAPRSPARRVPAAAMPDRLLLSGGGEGGDPSLRLSTGLASWSEAEDAAREVERESLRLEFRTLLALNEQAISQLATAEKLRNLEIALSELQRRAGEVTERLENRAAKPVPESMVPTTSESVRPSPAPSPSAVPSPLPREESGGLTEWSFYGTVLGALLGIGGWLGWKQYRQRKALAAAGDVWETPELVVDPPRDGEDEAGVDLPVELAFANMPMAVDVHLDADLPTEASPPPPPPAGALDSSFSIAAATVHEHFEANPVMELAEIMLSFGRVKGAAQALQEFIDQNPNEALKPWIRLLDVYRMANMQDEFVRVAENLNKHFNVEVLQWDSNQAVASTAGLDFELEPRDDLAEAATEAAKPRTVEDLPHIRDNLIASWQDPTCSEYLHRLLRDNRGGKRSGFSLSVVDELLFLIELRDLITQMEKEALA